LSRPGTGFDWGSVRGLTSRRRPLPGARRRDAVDRGLEPGPRARLAGQRVAHPGRQRPVADVGLARDVRSQL